MHQQQTDHVAIARQVISSEVDGLKKLIDTLDSTFDRVVNICLKTEGRIIVSGVGKSGIIGHKVAATLSSTGTPAFFVHANEASHGDLGMITTKDTLLLLSNSGQTAELNDLIYYAKRFQIPLVAIVGNADSILAHAATHALVLPEVEEASSIAAPTTSTTMMLALGDALAVALQQAKHFTSTDFLVFHPGGKLGAMFTTVGNIMRTGADIPLTKPDAPMSEVLVEMTAKTLGCVGVSADSKQILGIITDGDLRRHMTPDLLQRHAQEIMTPNPKTISSDILCAEALNRMETSSITSLFVVDDGSLVGILHIHDCLKAGVA
jgi:arabinose-5-phosphate isomerase